MYKLSKSFLVSIGIICTIIVVCIGTNILCCCQMLADIYLQIINEEKLTYELETLIFIKLLRQEFIFFFTV